MSPYRFGSTQHVELLRPLDEAHADRIHQVLPRLDLGYSAATSRNVSRNRPSVNFMMFAFVTHDTRVRP